MGLRLIKIWWELNVLMLLNIYGSVKQKKIIDKPKNNRQFAHNTIFSGALICKILFTIIFLSQINFSWSSAHNRLRPDMVWCYSGDHVWLSTWLLCDLQVIRRDIFRGTQTPREIKHTRQKFMIIYSCHWAVFPHVIGKVCKAIQNVENGHIWLL